MDKINAVLKRIEEDQDIGPVETSLELFQKVYRNPNLPLHTRMRAAAFAKDHEFPKLGVSVNIQDDGTFAARLDAAIARANGTKVIEHQAQVAEGEAREISAAKQAKPFIPSEAGKFRRRV